MNPAASLYHYLPVNDSSWRWGIYLTGIGRAAIPPGHGYPPERHPTLYAFSWLKGRTMPEFAVVSISSGRGVFESERTGRVEVRAGSLMFLFPGVWHRYRPARETGWTERWITLSGELVHRLLEQGLVRPETAVREASQPRVAEQALDDLLLKVHANPARNSILLSLHTMGCLGQLIEAASGNELPDTLGCPTRMDAISDPLVARAIGVIWTQSHHLFTVPRIALALGVNRRTLERRFRQALGHSILEEITVCRLSRAKELLVETALPIKVVTFLAGFTSEERMRLGFLAHEGISPSGYRRKARRRRR